MLSSVTRCLVLGAFLAGSLCVNSQKVDSEGSGKAEPKEVRVLTILDLCENNLGRVNRLSQITELSSSKWLESDHKCFPKQVAVYKVKKTLELNKLERMCTLEAGQRLDSTAIKIANLRAQGKKVPQLEIFLDALRYQLSSHCKQSALTNVDRMITELEPRELKPVLELEQHGGFLLNPKELSLKNGDIWATYYRLSKLIDEGSKDMKSSNVPVSKKTYEKLNLYKQACGDIYYPMFYRVFRILEILSSGGFDRSLRAGRDFATNPGLLRWLNMKLSCDMFNDLKQFDSRATAGFRLHFEDQLSGSPSLVLENRLEVDLPEDQEELNRNKSQSKEEAENNVKTIYKKVLGDKIRTIDKMFMRGRKMVEQYLLNLDAAINKSSE